MDISFKALLSLLLDMGEPILWFEFAGSKAHAGRSPCNFASGDVNWCAIASTYDGMAHPLLSVDVSHPPLGDQHDGTPYRAKPGDRVTYDCKFY